MKFQLVIIFIIILFLIFLSCGLDKPTEVEGTGSLRVLVLDDSGEIIEEAVVYYTSHLGEKGPTQLTDSTGITVFSNVSSSEYTVKASRSVSEAIDLIGSKKVTVVTGQESEVTINVRLSKYGLKINEVYYAGPVNDRNYFYDQYIELINNSADTVYLDGTMIINFTANNFAGKDNDGDGDIDYEYCDAATGTINCVHNVFQLPGDPLRGRKFPLLPGECALIAGDAIDHSEKVPGGVNLSCANYEFFNFLKPDDPHNENVPDYENIIIGDHGKPEISDFNMGLKADIILLASGEDSEYWDGIDLKTIIDGIEYTYDKDAFIRLDDRIDEGVAGVEADRVITKFSGMSIQRILPGFDTNNSTVDFQIMESPTPGY